MAPSPYWGEEAIWDARTSMHSLIMDERGDVWFTSRVGKPDKPGVLPGRLGPSVRQGVPDQGIHPASRRCTIPRPATTKLIRTCFNTHHVVLAEDADNTVWVSAGGPQQGAIGWLNRKV